MLCRSSSLSSGASTAGHDAMSSGGRRMSSGDSILVFRLFLHPREAGLVRGRRSRQLACLLWLRRGAGRSGYGEMMGVRVGKGLRTATLERRHSGCVWWYQGTKQRAVVVGSDLTSAGWTSSWFHHRSVLSPRAGRVHHCRDQEGCGRKHRLQYLGGVSPERRAYPVSDAAV